MHLDPRYVHDNLLLNYLTVLMLAVTNKLRSVVFYISYLHVYMKVNIYTVTMIALEGSMACMFTYA